MSLRFSIRIPLIAKFTVSDDENKIRKKRSDFDDNFFDDDESSNSKKDFKKILEPFMNMNMQKYCEIVDSLPKGCMRENFLELWKSNSEKIETLTKDDILMKLNKTDVSPETGHAANFVSLLGAKETNNEGYIISARSLISSWMLHINFSEVDSTKLGNMAGTEGYFKR